MLRIVCKSKIHRARVTETNLKYMGSVTIDRKLLDTADIVPGEQVQVVNLNNGARVETYCMAGKYGSGTVCMNGPAARRAQPGDEIIIISYGLMETDEARRLRPKVVFVNGKNRVVKRRGKSRRVS